MASSSRHPPARSLLALFGPTASGKTAVAGILRDRIGATVVSADSAALYEGLPLITAAPSYPAELVGILPLDADVSVGAYQRLAQAAVDAADVPLVVGRHGPVLPRGAFRDRAAAAARAGPPRALAGGGRAARPGRSTRSARRARSRRGGARPCERPEAARPRARARRGRLLAGTRDRPALDGGHAPADADRRARRPAGRARPPDRRTGRAMAAAGAAAEARAAWARPLSATARKVLGLEQFATLPEDEAVAAVALATRRLARYQRKWLRRMPGVTTLDGRRPAGELADEIVSLGRAGKHLPGH